MLFLDHAHNTLEMDDNNFTDAATGTYLSNTTTKEETEGGWKRSI